MTVLVATNVVASQPLKSRPTGSPTALAKNERGGWGGKKKKIVANNADLLERHMFVPIQYTISYQIEHQQERVKQSSPLAKRVEGQEGDALPGGLMSSESPVPIPKVSHTLQQSA